MKILHFAGPMCCGKSYLTSKIHEKYPDIPVFDVKQIHIKHGSIVDGEFNWDKFRENRDGRVVENELVEFLRSNREQPLVILESSGTNQEIHDIISRIGSGWAEEVFIPIKPSNKWETLAKKAGVNLKSVESSNDIFWKKVDFNNTTYNQKEAAEIIRTEIAKVL